MPFPDDYWGSYEHVVSSLGEFFIAVQMISAYQSATNTRFVWRGMANARFGLHSSLVRAYMDKHGSVPLERALRTFEGDVIDEARSWGLDWHSAGGRLSALELLAALQHYGVPTRFLDFTFNPLIALWFGVEKLDDLAGRVFAIEISERLVPRDKAASAEPWWLDESPNATSRWCTQSWIWRPPPFEPRMVRQEGCFLMGGVPSTQPARAVRTASGWRPIRAQEVRDSMTIPFVLINYQQAVAAYNGEWFPGAEPHARSFTLRIENKPQIRADLLRAFSYSHESLFPDFPGIAQYGRSFR